MKSLILLASLFVSSLALAQSQVIISADVPVSCAREFENHQYLNWIYNLQKVQESEESVSIRFTTSYGSCVRGQRLAKPLSDKGSMLALFQDKVVLFQKQPYKTKISQLSAHELQIDMTFDKKRIFKKASEREFDMNFIPGETISQINPFNGKRYFSRLEFQWDITVLQKADRNIDIQFGSISIP